MKALTPDKPYETIIMPPKTMQVRHRSVPLLSFHDTLHGHTLLASFPDHTSIRSGNEADTHGTIFLGSEICDSLIPSVLTLISYLILEHVVVEIN